VRQCRRVRQTQPSNNALNPSGARPRPYSYAMADSTASSTLDAPRPATTRRRARAASSNTGNRPARAAHLVEDEAEPARRTGRGNGVAGDRPVDLFPADDALAAAYTMNLDPRQRTLDGFELPADALAAQTERPALGVSGRAVKDPAPQAPAPRDPVTQAPAVHSSAPQTPAPQEPALPKQAETARATGAVPTRRPDNNTPDIGPQRRQTPARQPAGRVASVGRVPDTPSREALAQTVAELQAALADERRAALESRRQTTRLVSVAILLLLLVLVVGVVQAVVSVRASRESAAAQEKTEVLLRAQQAELAALSGAASAAAADVRGAVAALTAKLAAPPPAVKRAPRTAHPYSTNVKVRSSIAT
jgi:hypothetical protein